MQGLRAHSVILMGKNTLMKRCVRLYCERTGSDTWAPLLDALVGNVGVVFTKGDLSEVGNLLQIYTLSIAQSQMIACYFWKQRCRSLLEWQMR